jgi:hypothetical protein
METDLKLKQKQAFWETPRNLVIIISAVAAIAAAFGYKVGQRDTQPTFPPGTTTTITVSPVKP